MSKPKKKQAPKQGTKRRRVRRTGTLEDALRRQWQGIVAAEEVLLIGLGSADHSTTLSAVHALTQANAAFVKMQETVSLQTQLDALREELRELKQAQGLRKVV